MDAEETFRWACADLPRAGVGSDATTRALLELAAPLPPEPRTLDIGCGPGRAALVLAAEGARVTGVDIDEPFLRRLRAAAAARGQGGRVAVERAAMAHLPHPDACLDLIWCEGAAYVMGVDAALRSWRRLLRPGAALVFTELGWTTPRPSPEARSFWAAGYPAMRDTEATAAAARSAGYDVVGTYLLPESDWWDEYYGPLEARLGTRPDADPATLAGLRTEIDLRRRHPGDYGYTGYVLRPR